MLMFAQIPYNHCLWDKTQTYQYKMLFEVTTNLPLLSDLFYMGFGKCPKIGSCETFIAYSPIFVKLTYCFFPNKCAWCLKYFKRWRCL